MTSITIITLMPHGSQSPNSRANWRTKHKHSQLLKGHTMIMVRAEIYKEKPANIPWHSVTLQRTYYHAVKRRRDPDNFGAMSKYAIDGLVAGGLLVDDDKITLLPIKFEIDKKSPRLELEVSNANEL